MTDYYATLGIAKDASDEDIKRAYRKLALKYHPDKNATVDTNRFQDIQTAYETLSDPDRRRDYDNPVPDLTNLNINNNNAGNSFPFDQFFAHQFFGPQQHRGASVRKLADHHYSINISLRDVFFGTNKRLKASRKRVCHDCHRDCERCHGNGTVTHRVSMGPFLQMITQPCDQCQGQGITKINNSPCQQCAGKGENTEEKLFEITIPKGTTNGRQFVFEQWGEQAVKSTDISGNLIVTVNVETDSHFVRQGNDLLFTVKLSLVESIVGKNLTIPHYEGDIKLHSGGFGIINPAKMYTISIGDWWMKAESKVI